MAADSPAQSALRPAVGLFGGRFDPVHRAHLALAQNALASLHLDHVRWIVAGDPPHKDAIASAEHRLAMVERAVASMQDPRMVVDDREVRDAHSRGRTYTADTLTALLQEFPNHRLVWLLGEDQLESFTTWSRWQWLLQHMELAVVRRPEVSSIAAQTILKAHGAKISWITQPQDSISSTKVRSCIQNNASIAELTPPAVVDYIQAHRLYQTRQQP